LLDYIRIRINEEYKLYGSGSPKLVKKTKDGKGGGGCRHYVLQGNKKNKIPLHTFVLPLRMQAVTTNTTGLCCTERALQVSTQHTLPTISDYIQTRVVLLHKVHINKVYAYPHPQTSIVSLFTQTQIKNN
jgi:hypothetical protein